MVSTRMYVQEKVGDWFRKLYAHAIQEVASQAGSPLEVKTESGPQADEQYYKFICDYLEKAQKDKIQRLPIDNLIPLDRSNFASPVVFYNVPEGHYLIKHERFEGFY
jgi:aldehyde dehydrogenase (NAD+)